MLQVVNRKAGYDDVEPAEKRQRFVEIVVDDFDSCAGAEAGLQFFQHERREVDSDAVGRRPGAQDQFQQPPVTRPEIQDSTDGWRNLIE